MELVVARGFGGGKVKGIGHSGVIEEGILLGELADFLVEKKKLTGLQKKNKAMTKRLQQQKKQGKQPCT